MKRRATKILSAFLALLMVVLVLPAGVITAGAETYGDTQALDSTAPLLTVSGDVVLQNNTVSFITLLFSLANKLHSNLLQKMYH